MNTFNVLTCEIKLLPFHHRLMETLFSQPQSKFGKLAQQEMEVPSQSCKGMGTWSYTYDCNKTPFWASNTYLKGGKASQLSLTDYGHLQILDGVKFDLELSDHPPVPDAPH